MRGLRIIPLFLGLVALAFVGTLFIEQNPGKVSIRLLGHPTGEMKLGLVVLLSTFVGMCIAGSLSFLELLVLGMSVRRLKRRIAATAGREPARELPENTLK